MFSTTIKKGSLTLLSVLLFLGIEFFPANAEVTTRFYAHLRYGIIEVVDFIPDSTVIIEVYTDYSSYESEEEPIYSQEHQTSYEGDGAFPNIPLEVGNYIEITDGLTTKSLVLEDVAVIDVDEISQTITVTAPDESWVWIEAINEFDDFYTLKDQVIGGILTKSFEEYPIEITAISQGAINLYDGDGDASADIYPGGIPKITVQPDHNWISAYGWDIDASLTITVEDETKTEVLWETDTPLIAERASWDSFVGELFFVLDPLDLDLEPGQYVTVFDGTTTKALIIEALTVDYVNTDQNTVGGTGPIDSTGGAWIDTDQGQHWLPVSITDDGEGQGVWEANFGDDGFEFDSPIYEANINVNDVDGDGTLANWDPPYFWVFREDDRVEGFDWAMGSSVTLSIDNPDTPELDYTSDPPAEVQPNTPWDDDQTYVEFDVPLDIQAGFEVTLTDGETSKSHIVSNISIVEINNETDTLTGTVEPYTWMQTWVHAPECCTNRHHQADENGNWFVNFSVPGEVYGESDLADIEYGSGGHSSAKDDDGDSTNLLWEAPGPTVCAPGDTVQGYVRLADGITPVEGSEIFFEHYDTGALRWSAVTDETGFYNCDLPEGDYRIWANAYGYSREYHNDSIYENAVRVSVNAATQLTDVNFTMDLPWIVIEHFRFNLNNPIVQDIRVRQAIAYGIDRERMIAETWPESPMRHSYLPLIHWAYTDEGVPHYEYGEESIQYAKDLLTAAGWIDSNEDTWREKDGDITKPLVITYLSREIPIERITLRQIFSENMAELGIQVEYLTDLNTVWFSPDFSIVESGWGVDLNNEDPYRYIGSRYLKDDIYNLGYDNPDADQLLNDANNFTTRAEKLTYYQDHQSLIMNFFAEIPLMRRCIDPDADCDAVVNIIDNAQYSFNPDQSDLDDDGVGDVADVCPNDPTDTCDTDNSIADSIGPVGGELTTPSNQVTITVPENALSTDTSVSITDLGSGYVLGDTEAVYGVNIGPDGTVFEEPITITMSWTDNIIEGYVDDTGQDEDYLFISKDGVPITDICMNDSGCDPIANTFSVQVSSLSDFLLVTYTSPEILELQGPQEPVKVGDPVEMFATFSGFYSPTAYSAVWDWGDETTSQGIVTNGEISGSHAYDEAGVYTVSLRVENSVGGSETSTYHYIVVYDPSAGFVTGGGWIDSPEGAFKADPTLSGKATFGFVSKYKKGASIPTGNTEFQFKVADLLFESTQYQWLLVTGKDYARFKGTGTINGEGEYEFMIWAGDANPDTFRIKIWEEVDDVETVVYDNGMDQPIGGGNIVIHTK